MNDRVSGIIMLLGLICLCVVVTELIHFLTQLLLVVLFIAFAAGILYGIYYLTRYFSQRAEYNKSLGKSSSYVITVANAIEWIVNLLLPHHMHKMERFRDLILNDDFSIQDKRETQYLLESEMKSLEKGIDERLELKDNEIQNLRLQIVQLEGKKEKEEVLANLFEENPNVLAEESLLEIPEPPLDLNSSVKKKEVVGYDSFSNFSAEELFRRQNKLEDEERLMTLKKAESSIVETRNVFNQEKMDFQEKVIAAVHDVQVRELEMTKRDIEFERGKLDYYKNLSLLEIEQRKVELNFKLVEVAEKAVSNEKKDVALAKRELEFVGAVQNHQMAVRQANLDITRKLIAVEQKDVRAERKSLGADLRVEEIKRNHAQKARSLELAQIKLSREAQMLESREQKGQLQEVLSSIGFGLKEYRMKGQALSLQKGSLEQY